MPTLTELLLEDQMSHLREIAVSRGWGLNELDGTRFTLTLQARDGPQFSLLVECSNYPGVPPAFHWYNPTTGITDQTPDTPKGSGYLHSSARICAPWNRLAYTQCDPKGPHGDWELASWMGNPHTGGTTTLAAMVLRIATELRGPNYQGRMG